MGINVLAPPCCKPPYTGGKVPIGMASMCGTSFILRIYHVSINNVLELMFAFYLSSHGIHLPISSFYISYFGYDMSSTFLVTSIRLQLRH